MLWTGMCRYYQRNLILMLAALHLFTFTQGMYRVQELDRLSNSNEIEVVRLTTEPADAVVPLGSPLTLWCAAAGPLSGHRPRLTWRFRADGLPDADHILSVNDPQRKQLSNGSLVIEKMTMSTAGQYQCAAAVDGIGTVVSRTALVIVAALPELVPGPRSILATEGGPVLLPCLLRSSPRVAVRVLTATPRDRRVYGVAKTHYEPPVLYVNVNWLKDGSPLTPEGERISQTPSGALEIDPATPRDAAHYTCIVALAHTDMVVTQRSDPIELRVTADVDEAESAPRFIAQPQPLTIIEGAAVTLECAAVGNPRPEINWLNTGVEIDLNDLDSRFSLSGAGSLRVQAARALDAGAYTCRAHNRLDSVDATTQLEVLTAPRVHLPGAPVVRAHTRGDVTLKCEVRGRPAPSVHWLKDGETLTPNNQDIALVDGSSLRISGVLSVDAGMFQCVAVSPGGSAQAAVRLVVLPAADDTQTNITKPIKFNSQINPKSFLNSLKTESSSKDSITTPAINLSHDIFSSLISDSDNLESTLYPDTDIAFAYTQNPDVFYKDYEDYSDFHAAQGFDLDTLRSQNSSLVLPPRNLRAVIVKHRFVTLSWEEPEEVVGNVTGYAVVYRVKGSEREQVVQGIGSKHEMNVAALQPNTTYLFSVLAFTDDGVSLPTPIIEAHTLGEESNHGAPSNVVAEPLGPHTVRVTWDPPTTNPDTYQLHYRELESGREQYEWVTGGSTGTLSGLRAATAYVIRVAAAGGALSNDVLVKTTSDAPAAPPSRVAATGTGPTTIVVRWEPPPSRTHRGQLTGYKIRYKAVSGGNRKKAESLTTPADARRAELRDLERATSYQIRICAINANGSGPFSEWVTATTQQQELDESTVPQQPPPLTTRSGRDWISVWWGAGEATTKVRGYALGWGLGVPDEHARNLPAHTHSHVIKELQPNAEYVISLRASNNLGLGAPVYATVRTLPPSSGDDDEIEESEDEEDEDGVKEVPKLIPPLGLKAMMLSGTTAVVYWTDPTLPKEQTATDGRRYVVRWSSAGGRARMYNATDLNCMIDDLKPFTQYEFSVKLIKGGRESAWSLIVTNTSLEAPPGSPPRDIQVTLGGGGGRGGSADLTWQPPTKPNGIIIGYVIMYSISGGSAPEQWTASAVVGDRRAARVDRLRPRTTYQFKVQARNSAGLGPFSQMVTLTTGEDSNEGSGLSGATSAWLWASAGGACAVLALAAALALSLCCRRTPPPMEPDRSTYQKSSASAAIKPPDLWIHHDQMELKHLDKSLHSSASKMSAGSVDGPGTLVSSTLTLGRAPAEYEPTRPQPPASLDRRHYVPTYVERWSASCSDSDETAVARSDSASRRHYPMSGVGIGCAATCERRPHTRLQHSMAHPEQSTPLLGGVPPPLGSPQSSLASLAPLNSAGACGISTCPLGGNCSAGQLAAGSSGGSDIYASAARERGHYVAYEPLGHYTHRDSLNGEGVSGATATVGMGSLQRRGGGMSSGTMQSFTMPSDVGKKSGIVRETSPYKKSNNSSPGHLPNRLQLGGPVVQCSDELEPLTPSRSTERLHREMQNLEGLMKDLSAITQQQFHC